MATKDIDYDDLSQMDSPASPEATTAHEALEESFRQMKEKSGWDMSRDMLWGYFFTNDHPEPLALAAQALSALGYRVVDTYLSDKDEPDEPDLWWLHVERVETHTVASLHIRNDELTAIAEKSGLGSYDGWDVGPVSGKEA